MLHNESLRLIVHTSIGGDAVRIRLSNTFGKESLTVGAASIALRASGSRANTLHVLHFSGNADVVIPAGASVLSDPEPLSVAPSVDLAVSLYLPGSASGVTLHPLALQTSYRAAGDATAAAEWPGSATLSTWPFLTEVEVSSSKQQRAVVALGSSTTDGAHSTADTNRRWTDDLFARLQASPATRDTAVLNEGISGNRVLHDGRGNSGSAFGPSAAARFDRDVLAMAGVDTLIVFEGGNDINHPGGSAPVEETITPQVLIAGYRQLVARAHEHGIRVLIATITPFEGINKPAQTEERERFRTSVNQWIMSNHDSDGAIDFSAAIADPARPARIDPRFDSGDHLHPNDAGYKAMADSINLKLLQSKSTGR
jgi:lysophospholipase L1-like esterase